VITSNLPRIREATRQFGWINGVLYLLDRLCAAISRGKIRLYKYYLVAQPVPQKPWLAAKRGATLEVRQISRSDPLIKAVPRPEWAIAYRFDQDAICLAQLKAGEFIGCFWMTLGPYREDEVRCRYIPLPEGASAWDFDVYLHADQRNGIAFLKLWDEANRFYRERNVRWSLSRISAFNTQSMLSHGRMGAKRMGAVTFIQFGFHQVSLATVFPYVHFSSGPESYPTYALNPERTGADGSRN
jgi:hypothetical protein